MPLTTAQYITLIQEDFTNMREFLDSIEQEVIKHPNDLGLGYIKPIKQVLFNAALYFQEMKNAEADRMRINRD